MKQPKQKHKTQGNRGDHTYLKGNNFWKLRESSGRKPLFSHPSELWNLAQEYFEYAFKRTWDKQEWVGKDGIEVSRKMLLPFSKEAMCNYIGITVHSFNNYKQKKGKHLQEHETNENNISNTNEIGIIEAQNEIDFFHICTRIEQIIFQQQYEGATVGVYNANIVARKLGLTDKQDITSGGKEINRLTGVKVELPEGMSLEHIEDANVIEEVTDRSGMEVKKNVS